MKSGRNKKGKNKKEILILEKKFPEEIIFFKW